MYCPKCGAQNAEGASFCSKCGNDLGAAAAPPAKQAEATGAPQPKKGRLLIGIGAVVLVAVVVLVLVLANPFAKNPLSGAKVGDVVHFGNVTFTDYRGGSFSDDIGWRVLAIEGGKALVVSEDIIDLRPYNVAYEDTTWEACDLRSWLNGDFYRGLPSSMQKQAATTQVANSDNPDYGTPGGNGTQDKVFLLSLDEADKCFSSDSDRQAGIGLITQQTIDSINSEYNVDIESYVKDNGGYYWWLRSPGGSTGDAAVVYNDGGLVSGGNYVANVRIGVRPALWLNL